mmetsp:Transcript_70877/g.196916  ORF Transcript_70877/g.196916 Transcript_70877/m.196916 type:complete len:223 (-) Transcript_70877:140-808(-)|eukprot:CAMPEP_0117559410 /NCGR_PEP_ID=MMETSP0784-20121206/53350_1 /TAXON_ID=39447 /ORGANISM="" /LENGTH=222 /DNA_ID=CAMNT_0005356795 /DNA_START=111 /DNA_END=779 /DNA_ORIENTATION=+
MWVASLPGVATPYEDEDERGAASGATHDEVAATAEAASDYGGEAFEAAEAAEELGELFRVGATMPGRRGTSLTWWESNTPTETFSEPDTYTIDSEQDTSVSSTRASTSATTGTTGGSASRLGRRSTRGFSVMIRGARSPGALLHGLAPHGYRGRSVTRRERRNPGAAMRHRHPTHTPSRRADTPTRRAVAAAHRLGVPSRVVPYLGFHEIGRVREEQAEGNG